MLNHFTRRKLGKDFTFEFLSKWFTKFIVNYIVNNNRILSKLFDVYNTIEISFKWDSKSLGIMTIVVNGEVKRRKLKTPREQTFFMKGWKLEGVFARYVLQVSRTHLSKVL